MNLNNEDITYIYPRISKETYDTINDNNQVKKNDDMALVDRNNEKLYKNYIKRGQEVQEIIQFVINETNILNDNHPWANLYDMIAFDRRLNNLYDSFNNCIINNKLNIQINHAVAIKANPIRNILLIVKEKGFGAECASYAEIELALSVGFIPSKIVYDSPCKTYNELKNAFKIGCYINLDNIEEINKLKCIIKELNYKNKDIVTKLNKKIGLRINPVVGNGDIDMTSTATINSKFGLLLTDKTKDNLFAIYKENPWIQGVHVHVGSQGCNLNMLARGVKKAVEFSNEINERLGASQIKVIDIGGGLPTIYDGRSKEKYDFNHYTNMLQTIVPELFSGKFDIITEFGRSLFVKPGITVSRVEAVKTWANQLIIILHVGANHFLRTAYLPNQWKHVFSVFNSKGKLKTANMTKQDLAGPMCFSGDFLGKNVYLPLIETGDFVVIHDSGGYTLSMYSKYNSRPAPGFYGYQKQNGNQFNDKTSFKIYTLKEPETNKETIAFWG